MNEKQTTTTAKSCEAQSEAGSAQPENDAREWQEILISPDTTQILAASFYNGSNELINCYQLVRHARAFAIADFRNGKLERFDCIPSRLVESKQWLESLNKFSQP